MKTLIALILLGLLGACGSTEKETIRYVNVPSQPPPVVIPPPQGLNWNTLKPILDQNCALSNCHSTAAYLKSEDKFLESESKEFVRGDSMPPGYSPRIDQWTDEMKEMILEFYDINGR